MIHILLQSENIFQAAPYNALPSIIPYPRPLFNAASRTNCVYIF